MTALRFIKLNYTGGYWYSTTWSDERDSQLIELRKEGLGYSKIAQVLGVTKNTAIGRAYRLSLCVKKPAPKPKRVIQFPYKGRCSFPMGDPGTDTFYYCCNLTDGHDYCNIHHSMTHQPFKKTGGRFKLSSIGIYV